jgi:hypothetical protein
LSIFEIFFSNGNNLSTKSRAGGRAGHRTFQPTNSQVFRSDSAPVLPDISEQKIRLEFSVSSRELQPKSSRADRKNGPLICWQNYKTRPRQMHGSHGKFLSVLLLVSGAGYSAISQGSFQEITILQTPGTQSLTSQTRVIEVDAALALPLLQFTFGFATDETVVPGEIPDSFTVTLQDASLVSTMIFLTADVSGVAWAPPTPGTTPIAPESVLRSVTPFPASLEPVLSLQFAYRVQAPLPSGFAGQTLSLHFDLFDNLNGVRSLGWFSDVSVVPEPRFLVPTMALLLLFLLRRKR